MALGGGFVIDSDWYWRIFEGDARFDDAPGTTAARDFLYPLAGLARGRFALDDIAVDPDGDGVCFRIAEHPVAIRCRGLRVDRFIAAINQGLAAARLDVAFAIVESRRYELRGVLVPASEAPPRSAPPD
ncbi:MAG TPA: hypothetical protein VGD37_22865 [Kofleriaceae bacterium]